MGTSHQIDLAKSGYLSQSRLEVIRAMVRPHVASPHAAVLLIALSLYFAAMLGWVIV